MTPRPTEIKKVAALLVEGAETPEDLAKSVISAVDEMRAERTTYVVVHQFGEASPFYAGHGPYVTPHRAREAAGKNPGMREARATAIVPVRTVARLERLLAEETQIAEARSQWAVVRQDAADFKSGARTVKQRGWRL